MSRKIDRAKVMASLNTLCPHCENPSCKDWHGDSPQAWRVVACHVEVDRALIHKTL
jgi:hypothetical protein